MTFAYASDCQNYYDATANGVAYQCEGREQVAFVHKGKDVDVVSGSLHNALEEGFTRCIRAVGDHPDPYTPQQLRAKAEFKNRKLEGMEMGVLETGVQPHYSCGYLRRKYELIGQYRSPTSSSASAT